MSTSFNYAKELFRHNMVEKLHFNENPVQSLLFFYLLKVVFQNGEGALQVLPPLVDVIPEARLNLVIYYLKEGNLINSNKDFNVFFSFCFIKKMTSIMPMI